MSSANGLRRFETDFNERHDGCYLVLCDLPVVMGDRVELYDGEGNSCLGMIWNADDGGLIWIVPNESTWRTAAPERIA